MRAVYGYYFLPLLVSTAIFAAAIWRPVTVFQTGAQLPVTVGLLALTTIIGGMLEMRRLSPLRTLSALVIHGTVIIFVFARFYQMSGFAQTEAGQFPSYHEAIYFSVVTWTTLGYGDLAPSAEARALAASQALLGYIFLGLLVGTAGELLKQTRQAQEQAK
ncbi:hypothetical protein AWH62_11205 [Maricaulis sp. W15]|uniref:Ion channel n=1 Tax=Maricaulis maris TaxID=74318 RepID=A0A495D0R0_9PROT|nr:MULTISPECIES: potassium channel family protein [Maricaulis]OLF72389.1 hypothetical protein AWH62_11205 [Maricaulis sp. W15]RKQ95135.1 ion channel [Maricaulis maris]